MKKSGRKKAGSAASKLGPNLIIAIAVIAVVVAVGLQFKPTKPAAEPMPPEMALSETETTPSVPEPVTETNSAERAVNTILTNLFHGQELTVDMAPDLLDQGTKLLNAGKLDEAILIYNKALGLDAEELEDLHFNLAVALARKGRNDEAIQHYRKAIEIWPEYSEAYNNLGNLLVEEERFDEAIAAFKKAIEFIPDYATAYNNLGAAYGKQGKRDQALIYFAKAVQLDPDYKEARYNLANTYMLQNRLEDAIREFQTLVRKHPDFTPAIQRLQRAQMLLQSAGGK